MSFIGFLLLPVGGFYASRRNDGGGAGFGTAFAVDGSTDDATCIASSFATGKEAFQPHVLEGLSVSKDADGSGGAGLDGDNSCFVGQEAVLLLTPQLESLSKTRADELWQPEMQRARNQAWSVGRRV